MNVELLRELVKLRYKLLWAKTRTRNGRIALFLAGYLLLVCVVAVLAAGGFGAAMVAVRSGKAEKVAQAVLTALYVEALVASVILGFGMNTVFSDLELRRYPLKARERRVARHFTGLLDPFWFLILALELGLVAGLYIFGAASFWLGLIAVLLLFVSNYLCARVIALLVDRLMRRKGGSAILMGLVLVLVMLPSLGGAMFKRIPGAIPALVQILRFTPPFGAAAAAVRTDVAAVYGLGLLLCWLAGLAGLLVALERRPAVTRVAEATAITWDARYERMAGLFGPRDAPFVAHWLRFYLRNTRFRMLSLLSFPPMAFMTYTFGRHGPRGFFVAALGTFPVITFLGTSRIAVNQFGYVGGAFRRYFLLPTDPAAALRAGSYAAVLLGSMFIPPAALIWLLFARPFDARMLLMLLGSAVTGLFVFHGLGLWVTLLNPRKGNYYSNFGNDLSALGNVVVIGGALAALFGPQWLAKVAPAVVAPENWWLAIPAVLLAIGFYTASLRGAGALFVARRERLLAVVEGRD